MQKGHLDLLTLVKKQDVAVTSQFVYDKILEKIDDADWSEESEKKWDDFCNN